MRGATHSIPGDRSCEYCGADISHKQKNAIYCDDKCYSRNRSPTERRAARERQRVEANKRRQRKRYIRKPRRRRSGPPVATVPLGRFVTLDQAMGGTAVGSAKGGYTEPLGGML